MMALEILDESIQGINLNSEHLNKIVLKKIASENGISFVSKITKESIENYITASNKKNASLLWKDLLIDAICLLKINDSREKLYTDSQAGLKIDEIRKLSTYGIDELSKYFDDFVEFESVLYGTGEFYRDHFHHVIQVWAVGLGLMEGPDCIHMKLNDGFKISDEEFHFNITENASTSISKSERWSMWTIIALCHDLGYPLEKASEINQKVKTIVNHFGCLNFNELNFSFDLLNSLIVNKFLKIVPSRAERQT